MNLEGTLMNRVLLFVLFFLALCPVSAKGKWSHIENGAIWIDTEGKKVQAHAAGFLRVGDRWYMIGEDRSVRWQPDVNMYSSTDLQHWTFENKIIRNGVTHPLLGKGRMIERPKLLYCKKTGKFVVWCHWEAGDYSASEAAVFQCDKVNGDYEYVWSGRPLGIKSRDCNVFQDEDGQAYFISTIEENQHLGLFRLSDDYLRPVECTMLMEGMRREAPAIVRLGNTYYMLSSACTGWAPNQCMMSWSKSLTSGWSPLVPVGDNVAYETQAASILKVGNKKSPTLLYVGDRWWDKNLPDSPTIIFPIAFQGEKCFFPYHNEFDIDMKTGKWRCH